MRQVRRPLGMRAAEELDEGVGAREVGFERRGERRPALRVNAFRQDRDAELLDIAADLLAFLVEIIGHLREEDRCARSAGLRPAPAGARRAHARRDRVRPSGLLLLAHLLQLLADLLGEVEQRLQVGFRTRSPW